VIVSEDRSEGSVLAVVIEGIVGEPTLHGCLCTEGTEEWMCFRFRAGETAVTDVTRLYAGAAILFANRLDSFSYFIGTEGSVLIVEAVTRAV
jgi:hypothetical protein